MHRRTVFLAVTALAAALVTASPAAAELAAPLPEPTVHPIQVTGPPAERLNLIILGDGYQADQQSLFRAELCPLVADALTVSAWVGSATAAARCATDWIRDEIAV